MKRFDTETVNRLGNKYAENPILRDLPPLYPGWEVILDAMLHELIEFMEEQDLEIVITQCKVKFGILRVYADWRDTDFEEHLPKEIYNIIKKYENLSIKVCKICGIIKKETVRESRVTYECMEHYGDRRA